MARNSRRRRSPTQGPTRQYSPPALGHTVGPYSLLDAQDRPGEGWAWESPSPPPVRPLIRTVLENPSTPPNPNKIRPRRFSPQSSTLQSRATGRSSDRPIRSPFLNATMVTPQLAERAIQCAKRGIRREVLFATRNTGKGALSPRKPPSKWRC